MLKPFALALSVALALFAATPSGAHEIFPVTHNEPITVRLLNGKSGRPLAYTHLILIGGYDQGEIADHLWQEEMLTDEQGRVRLSGQLANLPWLQVELLKGKLCQVKPESVSFSVERIRRDGLSTPNRCGIATVQDAPGVFTVFAKNKGKIKGKTATLLTTHDKDLKPASADTQPLAAAALKPAPMETESAPPVAFEPLEALPVVALPVVAEIPFSETPAARHTQAKTGVKSQRVAARRRTHRPRRTATVCQVPAPAAKIPTEETKSKPAAARKPARLQHKAAAAKRLLDVPQIAKKSAAPVPPATAPPAKPEVPTKK
jgi:hypothetical protein